MHKEIVPNCSVLPAHGDKFHLTKELSTGEIDVAVITLPVDDAHLCVEVVRNDRIVVCLRRDHPLAKKPIFQPSDLKGNLTVLYHPERHPHAHQRHRNWLGEIGVEIDRYSRANHPIELRELVKQGYGFALVREGSRIDDELTTRAIVGVDWGVSIAIVYNKERHPKTVPLLARHLKRHLLNTAVRQRLLALPDDRKESKPIERASRGTGEDPVQMSLLG